jgi:hypothetical protein
MIALIRFHLDGYVRSLRVLHPLIAVGLVLVIFLFDGPSGPNAADLAVGSYGDVAAFLFPIAAWAARGLLDTEPDGQRDLSSLAVGRRSVPAGLLAAYLLNLALGAALLGPVLVQGVRAGAGSGATAAGIILTLLVAVPATLLGAWTSRAVLPSQAVSILVLLGGSVLILILGLGPLSWLTLPMIQWLNAAHHGSADFTNALPGIAAQIALWSAVVGGAYLIKRTRLGGAALLEVLQGGGKLVEEGVDLGFVVARADADRSEDRLAGVASGHRRGLTAQTCDHAVEEGVDVTLGIAGPDPGDAELGLADPIDQPVDLSRYRLRVGVFLAALMRLELPDVLDQGIVNGPAVVPLEDRRQPDGPEFTRSDRRSVRLVPTERAVDAGDQCVDVIAEIAACTDGKARHRSPFQLVRPDWNRVARTGPAFKAFRLFG